MSDEQKTLRICHIADVHWRGLSRHDEFRYVFEHFYKKVAELGADVIYIGGDIFHTKTQNISPEIIENLGWWFTELSKLAHVVVTLGNHDGNLMNRDRQDAITPILKLLNNDNISLYKNSGVYQSPVPGFNWCVFSCFDEKSWHNVRPIKDDVNIAFFHGGVHGSKTEADFALQGEIDASFFDGYDFALLGDIHKTQFLAYRDCIDDQRRPWIAYCGSTIQQNYAEDPEHGFLYWKIRSRNDFTVDFVALPNPSRFVTLDWEGDVDDIIKRAEEYPDGVRYRIRSKGTIAQTDWRRLDNELRRRKRPKEIVPKVEIVDEINTSGDNKIAELAYDLRKTSTHMELFRRHGIDNVPDEMQQDIEKLVDTYIREYGANQSVTRNIKWSLEALEFNNTFAYGVDNHINFAGLSGITGIFAPNAMGKSSIIGTIMYALFNATDRGPMKNIHVINIRKAECIAKATLTANGHRYVIERVSKKMQNNSGHIHAVTALDFSRLDVDENLNGTQRSETEKKIRRLIGTPDDFMLTSLAVQGGLKSFISEGASQRKAILSRFFDLQIFEWMHERAKQDSAELRGQIKDLPERDWDGIHAEFVKSNETLSARAHDLKNELTTARLSLQEKQVKLASQGDEQVVTETDLRKQTDKIERLTAQQKTLTTTTRKLQAHLDSAEHRLYLIENVKKTFPLKSHEENEERRQQLLAWIASLEQRLENEKQLLEQKKRSVLKLVEVPCGDKYPTCKYISDSHVDNVELPGLKKLIEDLLDDLSGKKTLLDSLLQDGSESRLKRYRRIVAKDHSCRLTISEASRRLDNVNRELHDNVSLLESERNIMQEMKTKFGKESFSKERRRIKEDIDDLQDMINVLDDERIDIAQNIGRIDEMIDKLAIERAEYDELAKKWRVYELLIHATSKKGAPAQLLRHLIPVINDEIARILNGIARFTVELELPDDNNAMDVYINYGDSRRIIELASGMEKMIASIAIRVALINSSSIPKTDMFIIDEGFSELDETNIDACGQLLRSLTRWFKNIIIITHIDTLKDVVDNVIDITRVGKDAIVRHD